MTKEQQVFIWADQAFNKVVQQIKDDQWSLPLPSWLQAGRTQNRDELDLLKIINYHAYDEAWVPETLTGKTIAEVGSKYDGDLLGADPRSSYQALLDKAVAAVEALDDPDKPVHLTYGDWPAREYLKHITSFRGLRAYDIAEWIGVDTKLPDDLVQGMWDLFEPEAEDWRKMGVFGEKYEVSTDASLQDKLMALCGRKHN